MRLENVLILSWANMNLFYMVESNFFNKQILPVLFGGMSTTPCPLRIHLHVYNWKCQEHLSSLCKMLHHWHFQVWRDCFLCIRRVMTKKSKKHSKIMIKDSNYIIFQRWKFTKVRRKHVGFFWLLTLSLLVSLSCLHYHTQHTHLLVCTHVCTHVRTHIHRDAYTEHSHPAVMQRAGPLKQRCCYRNNTEFSWKQTPNSLCV